MRDWRSDVLAWGAANLRDLPWRRTRDPWAVLVSEVMLQQTQVARVVERWARFLARYPDPASCAAAPLGDVLREWQGLGYPRRARNLHTAAAALAAAGTFPTTVAGLMALPGVGAYTARAVMAFAFEADVGVVDTNVARVYARRAGRQLTTREVRALAEANVPDGEGWLWNQSLMELGAMVCRPAPACSACPVAGTCAWRGAGPDPAIGSAGVSGRQPRFAGSDREARGRLMRALGAGPLPVDAAPAHMGRDPDTASRLVASLVRDGLVEVAGGRVRLAGDLD